MAKDTTSLAETESDAGEATAEAIEEIAGVEAAPSDQEAVEESLASDHTRVSKPLSQGTGSAQSSENDEAAEEGASEYEAGWTETSAQEADTTVEATVDASQAEAGEEFFAFLLPLLKPLATAVLPQLVGAAANAGSGLLKNLIQSRASNVRNRLAGRREASSDQESGDEASLENTITAESAAELLGVMEVVIGKDDRKRETSTRTAPWNRICHLRITAADGTILLGTGFLIGYRSVVTAGHCVYLRNNGGWARSIEVSPGRNGSELPYGKINAKAIHSVTGWTQRRKRECDYGFITLDRRPSPFPGAFGVRALEDAELTGKKLNTAGYPGDKAQSLPGSMWRHGRKATNVTPTVLTYDIDTAGGQSGSAVWIKAGNQRTVVGIHTNGAPGGNSATRISRAVLANLIAWRQEAT